MKCRRTKRDVREKEQQRQSATKKREKDFFSDKKKFSYFSTQNEADVGQKGDGKLEKRYRVHVFLNKLRWLSVLTYTHTHFLSLYTRVCPKNARLLYGISCREEKCR